ncbi:MAG: glutamate--tRNA ligase [Rickettsiales bacterium]|nr:MAG: glutamate--tRNA ligase [Rickettsiales bacterium]
MSKVITRFAPSPTGALHIGNVRTALINYLYSKAHGGEFILRMDDTDLVRSKDEYKENIKRDLKWLGLEWDSSFNQLSNLEEYEQAKAKLIAKGRLYPCYETPEELDIKRKLQLSRGKPPIYDRAALDLSPEQIAIYEKQGRTPHYRFLVESAPIIWDDMVKGTVKYHGSNLSDPVIIRADGSMTYMLCSTIDDINFNITHVIRGEDHVSNTAIQIQMFEALGAGGSGELVPSKLAPNELAPSKLVPGKSVPVFGHLSLVKAKDEKISKRDGGFEISALRGEGVEPMALNSFLGLIGTSVQMMPHKNMRELIEKFDITTYSKSPTTYIRGELDLINHKLILTYDFADIQDYLAQNGLQQINEKFWLAVRPNLQKLSDIKEWWRICHEITPAISKAPELMKIASDALPEEITDATWKEWTKAIMAASGKKGKELFMPLRLALTGMETGPELKNLLPLLSRQEILKRLR